MVNYCIMCKKETEHNQVPTSFVNRYWFVCQPCHKGVKPFRYKRTKDGWFIYTTVRIK